MKKKERIEHHFGNSTPAEKIVFCFPRRLLFLRLYGREIELLFFLPFRFPSTPANHLHTHTLPPKIHENKKQTRRTNETNKERNFQEQYYRPIYALEQENSSPRAGPNLINGGKYCNGKTNFIGHHGALNHSTEVVGGMEQKAFLCSFFARLAGFAKRKKEKKCSATRVIFKLLSVKLIRQIYTSLV